MTQAHHWLIGKTTSYNHFSPENFSW